MLIAWCESSIFNWSTKSILLGLLLEGRTLTLLAVREIVCGVIKLAPVGLRAIKLDREREPNTRLSESVILGKKLCDPLNELNRY